MAHRKRETASADAAVEHQIDQEMAAIVLDRKVDEAMAEIDHGFTVLQELQDQGLIKYRDLKLGLTVVKLANGAEPPDPEPLVMRCHCGKALYSKEAAEEHRAETGH